MEKNKAIYFSHDTNASNDPKIINLRVYCGWEGVGIYWAIIEALHKEINGELSKELISSLILDFYYQEEEKAKKLEKYLYATALLIDCNGNTTSKRVKENLNEINKKSITARDNANKRWLKTPENTNENTNNANAMRSQSKRNAIKEKKRKENIILVRVVKTTPLQLEVDSSIIEKLIQKGFPEDLVNLEIKKFISYWTETSRQGKQRWLGEKYFDVNRRIATWFSRIATDYNKNQPKTINLDNL